MEKDIASKQSKEKEEEWLEIVAFQERLVRLVGEHLERISPEGTKFRVTGKNELMINEGLKHAVRVSRDGEETSFLFWIDELWHPYNMGERLENLAREIADRAINQPRTEPDAGIMEDYAKVKDRIYCFPINRERNRELLEEIPHVPYLDLEVVFMADLNESMEIMVRNEDLERWGTGVENLYFETLKSMAERYPYRFRIMTVYGKEEIGRMGNDMDVSIMALEDFHQDALDGENNIFVLYADGCPYGAAAVLYQKALEEIASKLRGDFYVLPSSNREVMVVKDGVKSAEELSCIVKDVNDQLLSERDLLSYSVYHYSADSGRLEVAVQGEGGAVLDEHSLF